MGKRILIIGGGIAGLSAGIYACKAGLSPIILEKNFTAGGNCSAWRRGDFCIDNCIHWMGGTKEGNTFHQIWREVGALGDKIPTVAREAFYTSEYGGKCATLWRDLDRTERELIQLSPEDEKEIRRFVEYTRIAQTLLSRSNADTNLRNALRDCMPLTLQMGSFVSFVEYIGLNLEKLAARFRHPLLQHLLTDFAAKEYEAYWLIFGYSLFTAGNGDIPQGGSGGVVSRMLQTYLDLGGVIQYGRDVAEILLSPLAPLVDRVLPQSMKERLSLLLPQHASGVRLANGEELQGDYVICACDLHHVFYDLLPKELRPPSVTQAFEGKHPTPVSSSFQVAFAVDGEMTEVDTFTFSSRKYRAGTHSLHRLCVKNYRVYGDYIAPPGKTVIQCSVVQYPADVHYWEKKNRTPKEYKKAKLRQADGIRRCIEEKFPAYQGKLTLLDCWTPLSYMKRNHSYMGAYMRFITTMTGKNAFMNLDIKGLDNVYLASQWVRYPGGIPTAASLGKEVIARIVKEETPIVLPWQVARREETKEIYEQEPSNP